MIRENIVIGKGSSYPLNGMLTLPDDISAPVPAVVLVHGSGSNNMDEKVGSLTPFKDLADGLAKYGIASIRYDKRSFAHGFKMLKEKNITVKSETIDDAVLAAQLLKCDSRIDSDNVFIIGHSMGAMLAPRIDSEGGDFKGLVLMAGTLRTLDEVLISQTEEMLLLTKGLSRRILNSQINKLKKSFENIESMSDEEAQKVKMGGGTTLYYFKELRNHPAEKYLMNLNKPVLIMQGDKDFQVKADIDFEGYKTLLADKQNVTFKLYENLNHCLVPAIYASIDKAKKEYAVERHINDNVIEDIAYWILSAVS